jgi:aspartyl/glutamyl-tRNA(Asn/Gln) amidotransferase C subunit
MSKLSISQEQVRHLARLASLHLDEIEERRMVADIGVILDYMSVLRTADLDDLTGCEAESLALRDDEPCSGNMAAEVLGKIADPVARGFVVPAFDARMRGPDRDDGS